MSRNTSLTQLQIIQVNKYLQGRNSAPQDEVVLDKRGYDLKLSLT